jgi:Acyl-CoA carboxylase epsilon subunit
VNPAPHEDAGRPAPGENAAAAVVVRGGATPEEVAALVVVLTAAGAGAGRDPAPGDRVSGWAAHSAVLRRPLGHGPGAWRAAARP